MRWTREETLLSDFLFPDTFNIFCGLTLLIAGFSRQPLLSDWQQVECGTYRLLQGNLEDHEDSIQGHKSPLVCVLWFYFIVIAPHHSRPPPPHLILGSEYELAFILLSQQTATQNQVVVLSPGHGHKIIHWHQTEASSSLLISQLFCCVEREEEE